MAVAHLFYAFFLSLGTLFTGGLTLFVFQQTLRGIHLIATSALKGSDPFTQFAIATLPITQRVNEVFLKIFGEVVTSVARPKLSEILLVSLLVGVAALTSATLSSKDSVAKEATKLKRQ